MEEDAMWSLEIIVLIVGALSGWSIHAWIRLLHEERMRKNPPPTTSSADRWINSPLKPPE
jgi:hypothetical protein